MAYNPSIYNPYGSQQFQPTISFPQQYQPTSQQQQPVDGIVWLDSIESAYMFQLPPNSVSPPLMLKNESAFIIKTTDGGGGATYQKGTFTLEPLQPNSSSDIITRADLDKFKQDIMEALNGKSAVQPGQTE